MCAMHTAVGCVIGQQCHEPIARSLRPRRRSARSRHSGTAGTSWRAIHQRLVELTTEAGHAQTERRQDRWARQRHSAVGGWQLWDGEGWEDVNPMGSTGGLGSTDGFSSTAGFSDSQLSLRALYPDGRPVKPHLSDWERRKAPAVQDLESEHAPQLHRLLKDLSERIPHGSEFWNYRDEQSRQTVLHMAATTGLHTTVEMLLRSGANPDLSRFRPASASEKSYKSSIHYELNSTGSSNASNTTADREWTLAYVDLISDMDGWMDRSDVDGCTPLFDAVKNGHYDVVALLRLHGRADPNLSRADGITPSMLAVWMRRWDGICCEDDRMFQALLSPMGELGGCRMSFSPLAALSSVEHTVDVARTTAEGETLEGQLPMFTVLDVAVLHGMHSYVAALLDAHRCEHGQEGVDELVFTQNLAVEVGHCGSNLYRCPFDCAVDLCSIAARSPQSFSDRDAVQSYADTARILLEQVSAVPSTVESHEAEETLMELANLYGSESQISDLLRLFQQRSEAGGRWH